MQCITGKLDYQGIKHDILMQQCKRAGLLHAQESYRNTIDNSINKTILREKNISLINNINNNNVAIVSASRNKDKTKGCGKIQVFNEIEGKKLFAHFGISGMP